MAVKKIEYLINENENEAAAEITDELNTVNAENESDTVTKEKKSAVTRLKAFFSGKKEEKKPVEAEKIKTGDSSAGKLSKKATADNIRKINNFLGTIENQLDKVDGQNKTLLEQLETLKSNNKSLLEQIHALTENNNTLTEQFNGMKKREKVAKTLAIISAVLAIGLSAYNIIRLILNS